MLSSPTYLAYVRRQRCAFCGAPPPSEIGEALQGRDDCTYPVCVECRQTEVVGDWPACELAMLRTFRFFFDARDASDAERAQYMRDLARYESKRR